MAKEFKVKKIVYTDEVDIEGYLNFMAKSGSWELVGLFTLTPFQIMVLSREILV